MKDKKKYLVLMIVSVMAFILITLGVTYSFFSYIGLGATDNTIKAGSVSFIYEETNKMGNGIKIEDALPISDTEGKESSNYFDFKVTSSTGTTIAIPYEITARKTEGSSDLDEYVKLYLTKVNGTSEQEVALSIYDNLEDSQNRLAAMHNDKTLYKGEIPVGATDYTENYRLRMWLNNDSNDGKVLDYSPVYKCSNQTYTTKEECETNNGVWNPTEEYNNQGQTFSIKINVYANGETATEEKIASATTTDINGIKVNNVEAVENTDDTLNYDYYVETTLDEANNIEVVTLNDGQTYTVENITEAEANTLKQVGTKKDLNLVQGDNYLKVIVTSANNNESKTYVVKVYVGAPLVKLSELVLTSGASTKDTIIPDSELKYKSYTEASAEYRSGLFKAVDTNGGYTYYFRGVVSNNYVKIGNDLWRIIRINEDGTIRIIPQNRITYNSNNLFKFKNNSNGLTYYTDGNEEGNNYDIQTIASRWYQDNIQNNDDYKNIVTVGTYCQAAKVKYGNSRTFENATIEVKENYIPSFSCPNNDGNRDTKLSLNVGLINVDELLMAGGKIIVGGNIYYLNNGANFLTMSTGGIDNSTNVVYAYIVDQTGRVTIGSVGENHGFRPVINLKANVRASGTGTVDDPYIVK